MPTYECSACGEATIERPFDVMVVERKCDECGEFCPHVNLDNHRVQKLVESHDIDADPQAVVAAVRGRL